MNVIVKTVAFVAILEASLSVAAEELLDKGAAKYLGWQTSTTEFTTCDKNIMKIEPGMKTIAKCQGPVFALKDELFTVNTVDTEKRIFVVRNRQGESLPIFYPTIAEKPTSVKFDAIRPGQTVGVEFVDALPSKLLGGVVRAEAVRRVP